MADPWSHSEQPARSSPARDIDPGARARGRGVKSLSRNTVRRSLRPVGLEVEQHP